MMFVTTNTRDRIPFFSHKGAAREAIDALYRTQERMPFFLYSFILMPDHFHMLCNVPEGGSISRVMYSFKRDSAFAIGGGPIWQSRFHCLIPEQSEKIIQYIHMNPVLKGLCERPEEYPWSSASGKWDVAQRSCFD